MRMQSFRPSLACALNLNHLKSNLSELLTVSRIMLQISELFSIYAICNIHFGLINWLSVEFKRFKSTKTLKLNFNWLEWVPIVSYWGFFGWTSNDNFEAFEPFSTLLVLLLLLLSHNVKWMSQLLCEIVMERRWQNRKTVGNFQFCKGELQSEWKQR